MYLGFSKNAIICKNTMFDFLPSSKHWGVIVDALPEEENRINKKYFVFHVRGLMFKKLKPHHMVMNNREVCKKFQGFKRLGASSRSLIRNFMDIHIDNSMTCQQYSHFVSENILFPVSFVDYIYGRIELYIVMCSILAMFIWNQYASDYWNLDYDLLMSIFLMYDYFVCFLPGQQPKQLYNTKRAIFAGISVFLCFTFIDMLKVNGYLCISIAIVESLIFFVFLPHRVKKFEKIKEIKKNKRKKKKKK